MSLTEMLPETDGRGFIFTNRGNVQHYRCKGVDGLLVATTRDAASKLVKRFRQNGIKLSIAEVGTLAGETLWPHWLAAKRTGAEGIYVTSDGETLDYYEDAA